MVIFYDLTTKDIIYTVSKEMIPTIPVGTTEEKIEILKNENKGFIGVPYEMDLEVFNYKVCFNDLGEFQGLQPVKMEN